MINGAKICQMLKFDLEILSTNEKRISLKQEKSNGG